MTELFSVTVSSECKFRCSGSSHLAEGSLSRGSTVSCLWMTTLHVGSRASTPSNSNTPCRPGSCYICSHNLDTACLELRTSLKMFDGMCLSPRLLEFGSATLIPGKCIRLQTSGNHASGWPAVKPRRPLPRHYDLFCKKTLVCEAGWQYIDLGGGCWHSAVSTTASFWVVEQKYCCCHQ